MAREMYHGHEISRRNMLKAFGLGAGAVSLGPALAACGGNGESSPSSPEGPQAGGYTGPRANVGFWNGWTGGDAPTRVPELIAQFNDEHDNIVVENNTIEWADYYQTAPTAVQAGRGPDVGIAHGDQVATLAAQQILRPVDEIIEDLGYSAEDFPAGMFDAAQYQDAQYGIPWAVTPLGLFYNKTVLESAGLDPETPLRDADEYLAALEALKASGVQGEWVDPYIFTGTFEWQSLLWQHGGRLFDDTVSKAEFNSDAGVEALTWLVDLVKNDFSPRNVGQGANYVALVNGETAFNWQGVWQTSDLQSKPEVSWGAAAVPTIGSQPAVWSSTAHWVFFNKDGQDDNIVQAAATFVQWFIDHSLDWAAVGELPAKNTVREDPQLLERYPYLAPFIDELEYAHYETPAPGIGDVSAAYQTAVNEAILMQKSPQEALDTAARLADERLEQAKQQYGG